MSDVNRRALLCSGCSWVLTGAVVSSVGCVVGGQGGGGSASDTGSGPGTIDTGTAATGAPECKVVPEPGAPGWEEVPLSSYPALEQVDGWAAVQVGGRSLNIAQVDVDCFVAMATACTHQGARVDFIPERGQFVCTLHGAVYVNDGTPIAGPTTVPLVTYPCARSGDSLYVFVG